MFRIITLILASGLSLSAFGQGTQLLRQPTLSQTEIVFVYANDLWKVPKSGGNAIRLTSNEGEETLPHFSPDGKHIAFTAEYDGNTDVYLIPSEGGDPKRLTWHPGADLVTGWTPDGNHITFTSGREGFATQESKFFKINKNGGIAEPMPIPRAVNGEVSPDGNHIAYQQIAFWDPEWRNHRGGQAKPIWIVDLKDYSLKMTPQTDNERHTDPIWLGKKVYYISERDYLANIWSYDLASGQEKQETFLKDFDIKSLDGNGTEIVYEQGGYLHLLNPSNGQSQQLNITVAGDFHWARERWVDVKGNDLSNPQLSPTGQRAIFEFRGEIITVPKENGAGRNVSNTSKSAERSPVWSPDGKQIAYFSDAKGEYELVIADQDGGIQKKINLPDPSFFFKPEWSPDGAHIAFTDTDYQIWVVNVASGNAKVVETDRYAHPNRSMNPVWSPDGKWIAYVRLMDNQLKSVFVLNVDSGKKIQIGDSMADAITPVWDESGKYLYFLASTDFGLNTGWLDMSSYDHPITRSLYLAVLNAADSSPLLPQSDEETEAKKEEKKSESLVTVKIDEAGIQQRIVAIDIPARNYTGLAPAPEGFVFYMESIPNEGTTLHKYDLKKRKSEVFFPKVSQAVVSKDRKSLLYQSNGTWGIVETSGTGKKSGDGALKAISTMKVKVNPMDEWQQIYREGWRYQRDFLYVDNVHGAPWDDIYTWYKPWVDHVRHRSDMNYIIDIIGGEVAVGHSYTRGGDFPEVKSVPIGLLGADYELVNGNYRIKKIYTGESWNPNLKAPLAQPGAQAKVGEYVVGVNGKAIAANTNLYQYFEGTANQPTKIHLNSKPGLEGSRFIQVMPVANEGQLRNIDWVEGNRRKVDELSGGKLAYVYIPNTGQPGYTSFNRYYFAQQDKKGAVIDERNNGGGSAADYMVDIMARDLQGYFNSRANDHRPFTTPMSGIWGPKVMLINERAGSGGDLLPYLFNKMKIGPLIGTKTWGGLVGTWDTPAFVDGGRMVAPRGGFYDVNGEWAVEGVGIPPDIAVEQTPKDVIEGRDPQLERAVKEALDRLATEGIELKPEPKAPIRYFRPKGN
ncbi:MAG: PDZ domain-containing protein [Algoriphagus sp.]|uniref:S41 family peptidase n=1 Tax=Algoriphagus sp. TaxID=1872435 RepID=UPI00272EEC6D|nr:S41 family peptidase [Algoriphagus sp.]MDP2040953.1 PDZ domain-containing protein [Algoriphagus sp.]MDP3471166.1 PDZ domain-containing protein [Algoriphagus sp.]